MDFMPVEQLRQLQLHRLQWTVKYAYERVPLFRKRCDEKGVRPEHIELGTGIAGTVDVSELMGSTVHLHVNSMGRDVVMVVSTMNMTGAEVAALANGNPVSYNFPGHCCHVFSKETGINLEA